jgi:chromate reductase, NAD(P)H dehydrogenase (quinone)
MNEHEYRIAVLVGSLRRQSYNRMLAKAIIKLAPSDDSYDLIRIDDLPPYNQDDDNNPAPATMRFKQEVSSAQALIIVTPEYNRSIPGVLKNAIDQGSRPYGQSVWGGKPAGILGASRGAPGTSMAQQHLRNVLAHLDVPTMGQPEVFFQVREGMFDAEGNLVSADGVKLLQRWMDRYVAWVERFVA